jgi:hypothetical protein
MGNDVISPNDDPAEFYPDDVSVVGTGDIPLRPACRHKYLPYGIYPRDE